MRLSGRRSTTGWTAWRSTFRAVSSSVCALHERWQQGLNCSCSTSLPVRLIRTRRPISKTIHRLREKVTILIVTHNMQQAARVSDFTAFMYLGELIEFNDTNTVFTNPNSKQTEDYITGRYG